MTNRKYFYADKWQHARMILIKFYNENSSSPHLSPVRHVKKALQKPAFTNCAFSGNTGAANCRHHQTFVKIFCSEQVNSGTRRRSARQNTSKQMHNIFLRTSSIELETRHFGQPGYELNRPVRSGRPPGLGIPLVHGETCTPTNEPYCSRRASSAFKSLRL